MNFLKKGPELKLSDLKVPGFLSDLYYDLKERHLLPLAAILVVALVAVPIALSSSGSEPEIEESETTPAGATAQGTAMRQTGQLVATSAPGLRDYRRRLRHLEAKDPFQQQYTEPEPETTESTSSEGGAESDSTESTGSPESFPTPPDTGTGGEGPTIRHHITYYSYAIDVRVTTGTSQEASTTSTPNVTVRRNLPELTTLPNRKVPAIIYMGSTRDGKKALMLISSDVDAIFGDGKCVLGSQTCELLAMETGVPETFVYGGAGKTFKVELLKIGLVESDKLNKAPLGEPPKKHNGG